MGAPDAGTGETARDLAAAALFAAATVVLLAAILPDLNTSVGPRAGDPVFNLYILKWGSYQISRGLEDFWDAPFYFPTPHVLAMSDHLLGPAAAFRILRGLGIPAAGAYNLLVLATFAIGGWAAYWVVRRSGVSRAGALLAGWAFAFSAFRWDAMGHYQTVRMQWIPLTVWSFDRLLEKPGPGRGVAFLAFYTLHISGGAYLAQLVHIVLLVLVLNRWQASTFRDVRSWAVWLPTAVLAVAIAAFFYGGYLAPESTLMTGQRPDELRRYGPTLVSFVPAPVAARLGGAGRAGELFPGYGVLLLALAGLVRGWRRYRTLPRRWAHPVKGGSLAVAGGFATACGLLLADRFTRTGSSLIPSLSETGNAGYLPPLVLAFAGLALVWGGMRTLRGGRVLDWSEMPVWPRGLVLSGAVTLPLCLPAFFWLASTVLPGMAGMRSPGRAFAFVALPLAYMVGAGWDRLWSTGGRRRLVPLALAALLVAESVGGRPTGEREPLPDEARFPAYAYWIAAHEEVRAYVELPRGRPPHAETVPMYLQTLHWRPIANGYSARHPPSYRELSRLCRPFPDLEGLRLLEARGITHVVVHWRALPWQPGPRVRARVPRARGAFVAALRQHRARRVLVDGHTVIYDIRSRERASRRVGPPGSSEDPR